MCDDFENGGDWLEGGGERTCEAPEIEWEWNPGDVGPYGDGFLVITARGDGFVMLEADERTRTGMDEATLNMKAEYGQTVTVQAYIARAGSPISDITEITIKVPDYDDIDGGEGNYEAPEIKWEWNPGDVGDYGDGFLEITARGDGFVMLEADGRIISGDKEATMYVKAEFGQIVNAKAYIARMGSPVSPITEVDIEVPEYEGDNEGKDENCKAPTVEWEWHPEDVGPYGDGYVIITARGNGFVMLETDENVRTGDGEVTVYIKAEYGQTITAQAYIARMGSPISPINNLIIRIPNK